MSTEAVQCRRLQGKVALVTAATAGIGLGIAERLASEGAQVMICSRRQANVDECVEKLRACGLRVSGCACHVADGQARLRLVERTLQEFGRIDILVSNAAVNPVSAPILDTPEDAINKILDVNVKAAVLLVQQVAPHLPRGGSIVFVSSATAYMPPAPISMYAISKTALLALTKGLAAELGAQGVRVNCVAPGIVPTKFAAALVATPELAEAQEQQTWLGRLGRPSDMAAAVAFLVSSDADFITGETLVVAGGVHSRL